MKVTVERFPNGFSIAKAVVTVIEGGSNSGKRSPTQRVVYQLVNPTNQVVNSFASYQEAFEKGAAFAYDRLPRRKYG